MLGSDYIVKSSFGHIRDLPENKIGVDIEKDFKFMPEEDAQMELELNLIKQSIEARKKLNQYCK